MHCFREQKPLPELGVKMASKEIIVFNVRQKEIMKLIKNNYESTENFM